MFRKHRGDFSDQTKDVWNPQTSEKGCETPSRGRKYLQRDGKRDSDGKSSKGCPDAHVSRLRDNLKKVRWRKDLPKKEETPQLSKTHSKARYWRPPLKREQILESGKIQVVHSTMKIRSPRQGRAQKKKLKNFGRRHSCITEASRGWPGIPNSPFGEDLEG